MISIYNTATRRKEPFTPVNAPRVNMYVCGITAYDFCHVGHARAYVAFDVIRRHLVHCGYDVRHVQNFTDIDDKIIQRAAANHEDPLALAERFSIEYFTDMDMLNVLRAHEYPRATGVIDRIVDFIRVLEDKGFTYNTDDGVYFPVRKYPEYGSLSGRDLDQMRSGARVQVNKQKKDPLDFALWKFSKPGEPSWKSPWGQGRPGWHIECSVMSRTLSGDAPLDIHGGGADLVFPHHENEAAQSGAMTGKPLAKYWMHNGFVTVKQEKMSKSLGNFSTLREVLHEVDPMVIRFLLLSTHYRSPLEFSDDTINSARGGWDKLVNIADRIEEFCKASAPGKPDPVLNESCDRVKSQFDLAMNDDFNSAMAIGRLFEFVSRINGYMDRNKDMCGESALLLRDTLLSLFERLGFVTGGAGRNADELDARREKVSEALVESELASHARSIASLEGDQWIASLVTARKQARMDKKFNIADAIRDSLLHGGIELRDNRGETTWKIR